MDNQEIKGRFNEMERMRDFILWLCEEELNDTVTACHERFLKWQEAEENTDAVKLELKRYYHQKKAVNWLKTPADTIWIDAPTPLDGLYIQPQDESLRESPLGIDLNLMEPEEVDELFRVEETTEIK